MTAEKPEQTLLDTLKAHQPDGGHRDLHQHCTCGWVGKAMQRDFLLHQSSAILLAGYAKQPESETEWGTRTKWGSRAAFSKQGALDYVELCNSCGDHVKLIKRRAAIEPGPWEDAE